MTILFSARMLAIIGACAILKIANAAPSHATEHRIECPFEMPQESLKIVSAPEGWTSSVRSRMLLHAVDISDGPPSAMVFLKPDFITSRGKKAVDKWIDLNTARTSSGAWIACNYGNSDTVILGRPLDSNVSECTVTYSKEPQRGTPIDVRCKR